MTDKSRLQSLFDAALKAPTDPQAGPPPRSFPSPAMRPAPFSEPAAGHAPDPPIRQPLPAAAPAAMPAAPVEAAAAPNPEETAPIAEPLDRAKADELGALLDERIVARKRKRRMQAMIAAVLLLGSAGGATAWLFADSTRIDTLRHAWQDIRSAGDIHSMVAQFQAALDRIAVRGKQIDQATAALGVDPTTGAGQEEYMEDEMHQFQGDDGGPTVASRNRAMLANFGDGIPASGNTQTAPAEGQADPLINATRGVPSDSDFSIE